MERYLYEGYLACVQAWGKYDSRVQTAIQSAETGLLEESPDALERVEQTLFAFKSKGIP